MKGLWVMDTEGNDLLQGITLFHCLCFKKYGYDEWVVFLDHKHPEAKEAFSYCQDRGETITVKRFAQFKSWLGSGDVKALACHFMYGFDLPAMEKLLGISFDFFPETLAGYSIKLFDTLSMSQSLYPDRMLPYGCASKIRCPVTGKMKTVGGHGLQSWGYRVANAKPAIDDWRNQPLTTYIHRCIEDVKINELTWKALIKEMDVEPKFKIDWRLPLRRNLQSDFLMAEQERQGVVFDIDKAIKLRDRIDRMMKEIEDTVEPQLPERLLPKSQQPNFPAAPFKGDGSFSSDGIRWLKRLGYEFDEEVLNLTPPPKTAFKGNGDISKAGENYCIKHGVEDPELMPDFIRSQLVIAEKPIFVNGSDGEYKARQDLADKRMPKLTEPMRLSNQLDIKKYLVEEEGWRPTMMGTRKGFDVDDRKQKLPEADLRVKIRKYIQDIIDSPFKDFVYADLDVKPFHTYLDGGKKEEQLMKKLLQKARYLPSTPKFKDERGELCPTLETLKGDMAKQIVKWLSLRNRRSVIEAIDESKDTGWLNNPRLQVDGKLGAASTGLTNTYRRKHTVVANIPKNDPSVLLGKEMRDLFTVPEGFWQIGTDASNLEGFVAAWLAWDFDNGAYYEGLSGDPHTTNAEAYSAAAGRTVGRGEGKAITYGVMYGAQATKVAAMLGISKNKAQDVIDAFWDTNYGLKGAKETLEKYWESTGKKWIRGIDGRKIYTRSKHSLLNARIQSTGALLCDLAGIIWHNEAKKEKLLDKGVARTVYYHDEYQHQVPEGLVSFYDVYETKDEAKEITDGDKVLSGVIELDNGFTRGYTRAGELMVKAFEQAAIQLNCPFEITGEYMLGKTWGDCH